MRRLALAAAVLIAGCDRQTATPAAGLRPPPPKPNMIFLFADDLGWADVGFNGGEIRTPHIDQLAARGVRLDQFYVLPVCTPSRAALLTGRYPIRYGLQEDVIRQWADYGLPVEERTLADALRQAGYFTAIAGKWHLGHCCEQYLPQNRGFDHQYGCYLGTSDYYERQMDGGYDWRRNGELLLEEGYNTDLIAAEVCRLVESRDPGRPFFLYVPFTAPHTPLQAPQAYIDQYAQVENEERRLYCAMVACLDDAIGRIVQTVEAAGLTESTLIVFCSDNGGSPQTGADNGPLKRGKRSLREGGVRVPAVVVWPSVLRGGSVVSAPLHIVDWYPTLVNLAGGSLEQPLPLDGRDLWAALAEGGASAREDMLLNIDSDGAAIRRGPWKLLTREGEDQTKARLFNLDLDPYEKSNVAKAHPDIVRDLLERLDVYSQSAADPLAQPQRPFDYVPPQVWGP